MNRVYATKTLLVQTMTVLTVVLVIKVSLEMEQLVKVLYVCFRVLPLVFIMIIPIHCNTEKKENLSNRIFPEEVEYHNM